MNCIEPEEELTILISNDWKLRTCGFYYGKLSWKDASALLRHCEVGTFLVRDSEHGSFLYSVSLQTGKGPTSIRIEYRNGRFRLHSPQEVSHRMPSFNCLPFLIEYYVHLSRCRHQKNSGRVVVIRRDTEPSSSTGVPFKLCKPLYWSTRSLQHLCRVTIVKCIKDGQSCCETMVESSAPISRVLNEDPQFINLPQTMKIFLVQYPYPQ